MNPQKRKSEDDTVDARTLKRMRRVSQEHRADLPWPYRLGALVGALDRVTVGVDSLVFRRFVSTECRQQDLGIMHVAFKFLHGRKDIDPDALKEALAQLVQPEKKFEIPSSVQASLGDWPDVRNYFVRKTYCFQARSQVCGFLSHGAQWQCTLGPLLEDLAQDLRRRVRWLQESHKLHTSQRIDLFINNEMPITARMKDADEVKVQVLRRDPANNEFCIKTQKGNIHRMLWMPNGSALCVDDDAPSVRSIDLALDERAFAHGLYKKLSAASKLLKGPAIVDFNSAPRVPELRCQTQAANESMRLVSAYMFYPQPDLDPLVDSDNTLETDLQFLTVEPDREKQVELICRPWRRSLGWPRVE